MPDAENVHFTSAVFLAGCFNGAPIHIPQSIHRGPRIKLYVTSCDRKDIVDKTLSNTAHAHKSMAKRFGVLSIVRMPN
jgi:hypothetical protein